MTEDAPLKKSRKIERLFLLMISAVFALLFFFLYAFLQRDFKDVDSRLAEGTMFNLNSKDPEGIRTLIRKGYYFEDKKDIDLIYSAVAKGLSLDQKPIDNIGELNKRRFFVDADEAFINGGESFRKRIMVSRSMLGLPAMIQLLFRRKKPSRKL